MTQILIGDMVSFKLNGESHKGIVVKLFPDMKGTTIYGVNFHDGEERFKEFKREDLTRIVIDPSYKYRRLGVWSANE